MTTPIDQRFAIDTAKHEMTIRHEDGLYRHLRFREPASSFYWFDLITWPGVLTISSDMGCFVFSRLNDMFEFFRGHAINPDYWAEKLRCESKTKVYDEDKFRARVLAEAIENEERCPGLTAAVTGEVLADDDITFEAGARRLIEEFRFKYDGGDPLGLNTFAFYETYEWDLTDWTAQFLWCCHAIVWGIAQYDARPVDVQLPSAS